MPDDVVQPACELPLCDAQNQLLHTFPNQCSRIRILRFFSDFQKHDFLRFFVK